MDSNWTLPIVSTIHRIGDNDIRDEFVTIFPELTVHVDKESEIDQVRGLTSYLKHGHSYCAGTWTSRAHSLLKLGYPELALGDATKATFLLDQHLKHTFPFYNDVEKELRRQAKHCSALPEYSRPVPSWLRIRQYAQYTRERANTIVAQSLFLTNSYVECYEYIKREFSRSSNSLPRLERLKDLAERAQTTKDQSRIDEGDYIDALDPRSEEERRSGSIVPQVYPWSEPYIRRNDFTLLKTRTRLSECSENRCYIDESSITDFHISSHNNLARTAEAQSKMLGIKAGIDLPADATFFVDHTFLSGIDDAMQRCSTCRCHLNDTHPDLAHARCCDARFCSRSCMRMAVAYHHSVCGLPLDLRRSKSMKLNTANDSRDTLASNDLLYRVLAYTQMHPAINPLRQPIIRDMVPAYHGSVPVRFSKMNDILRPMYILMELGVNIFEDHSCDTWVLLTIQARLRNNSRVYTDDREQYHIAINPLYMFFNHSCVPNIRLEQHGSGSSHVVAITTKEVRKHEELFISYLRDEDLDLLYDDRQELLKGWTGGECLCERCEQERKEIEEAWVERE